jgi:hypothetical protein
MLHMKVRTHDVYYNFSFTFFLFKNRPTANSSRGGYKTIRLNYRLRLI